MLMNVSKKYIPFLQIGEAVNKLVLGLSQLSVDQSRSHALGKLIDFITVVL
jgi:hypothetical protein